MAKILLDPGHGKGPAYNRGSLLGNEGDNNYAFSLVLAQVLRDEGHEVASTRARPEEGSDDDLRRRGEMGEGFDLFLSLHSNAASSQVRGVEVWGDVNPDYAHPEFFSELCLAISQHFKIPNRGVRYRSLNGTAMGHTHVGKYPPGGVNYYGVLRYQKAKVGCLVEHVFHTNLDDCSIYVKRRRELAEVMAGVIRRYFPPRKPSKKPLNPSHFHPNKEKPVDKKGEVTMISYRREGDLPTALALFSALPHTLLVKPECIGEFPPHILVGGQGENRGETLATLVEQWLVKK